MMGPFAQERPCIHIALAPGVPAQLFNSVQLGAEEEGVPCRLVQEEGSDGPGLAYAAAQSSRFNIGIAVMADEVVLHEVHMPPGQPVLTFGLDDRHELVCRLMGSNAARLVVRRPLRFLDDLEPGDSEPVRQVIVADAPAASEPPAYTARPQAGLTPDTAEIAKIVTMVVRKLRERGVA